MREKTFGTILANIQKPSVHIGGSTTVTKGLNKMLPAGVLVPVHKATPWINSFILVKGKDNLGNLKLYICFDLANLNKVITREPYHFRMPKDIAHLLADACIMTVCDCKKGYWHQKLDEASSYLTTFNTEFPGIMLCNVKLM